MTNSFFERKFRPLLLTCSLLASLFMLSSSTQAMSFELVSTGGNCNGCEWIAAQGRIMPDTAEVFEKFMREQSSGVKWDVKLDSPGGNLAAGVELGLAIRRFGLNTSVGKTVTDGFGHHTADAGICASACAYTFLGGVSRSAKAGEIGLHQFYSQAILENLKNPVFSGEDDLKTQSLMGFLALYVHRMGVDAEFLFLAASTNPQELVYLDEDQLEKLKVTTEPDERFVDRGWTIEPTKTGAVAVAELSNGVNEKNSLSVYCQKKSKKNFLMLTVYSRASAEDLRATAFSSTLIIDNYTRVDKESRGIVGTGTSTDGRPTLTFSLSDDEVKLLLAAQNLQITVELPHVFNFEVGAAVNVLSGYRHIRLALRNCL